MRAFLFLLLLPLCARAHTGVEVGVPLCTLYSGATIVQPRVAYTEWFSCSAASIALTEAAKKSKTYKCRCDFPVKTTYSVSPVPPNPNLMPPALLPPGNYVPPPLPPK